MMKTRLTRKRLAGGLGLLLALALVVTPSLPVFAAGPPVRPHTFWGSASVCTTLAVGADVSAEIDSTVVATTTVDQDGHYGYETEFKFPGETGDLIQFYIDDKLAEFFINGEWLDTFTFEAGGTTEIDLVVREGDLTVTANPPAGGTVTGDGTFACDTLAPITADPAPGYEFVNWTGATGITDPDAEETTVLIDGNKTVTANFNLVVPMCELTILEVPDAGGDTTGAGEYPCGDTAPITADAADGWYFINWTGVGIADPNAASTTVLVDVDKTITANFSQTPPGPTYNLTVLANPANCGIVTGTGTYAADTLVAISVDPDVCCTFVNWTGAAGITDPNAESTTVLLDADKTVTANLNRIQYTLTVVADPLAGGNVTGGGTFDCCTNAPITATAEEGYYFFNWTGAGADIDNPNSASTTVHIDGDRTVTANFALEEQVYLTVNSSTGGTVSDPGVGTFPYLTGDEVDLVAERDCGYVFESWSGDVGTVADVNDPSTTIIMNDNYEVTANFASGLLMEIDLDAEWNTFSTPIALDPCIATWQDFVDYCGLDYEIGYYYNVETEYWGLITGDRTVTPLEGYFVSLGTAGTALIVPNPNPTPVPFKTLTDGLNLIGLASLVDRDVETALTDVYEVTGGLTGYSRAMNPPINTPNDWVDDEFFRDDTYVPTMEVGYSYWVIMINPGTVYGFTSTPLP